MNPNASATATPLSSTQSQQTPHIPGLEHGLSQSPLQGFKTLLMGPGGTGKTHSLRTLLDHGLEVCGLFLDPGYEILGKDLDRMNWRYIKPSTSNWKTMINNAKTLNSMTNDGLQKLNSINPQEYLQFVDVLEQLANFKTHDGRILGPVDSWGTDKVLAFDNLSIMSAMVRRLGVGAKPIMTQPDWGKCMQHIEDFLDTFCYGLRCHAVLLAHIEPEKDETTGNSVNMASTLGRKLAPHIPLKFSDVVLTKLSGKKFSWRTTDANTDLKTRYLPLESELEPDFGQIVRSWKAKGGIIERS